LFSNDRGHGPRGTPTIDGERLYVLGASGDLTCLETAKGRKVWSVNVLQTFGGHNPRWGLSESPLVLGDRVLVNAGGPNASIVALKKGDGSVLWKSQSDGAAYSSAVPHRIGGVQQAVFFTAQRALGVDVSDGRLLWEYPTVANRVANAATPIARGSHVFLSSDYGTGAALLELQANGQGVSAREVYFTKDMRNHHSSSVLVGDHLYGFSSAILTALRFDTGQVAWRDRSVGKGSLIYADNRLYLFSENGVIGLAEANPQAYREHGRFRIETGSQPTWAHPVIAGGHLFIRDQDTIYAYDIRQRQ
jgi:outer membrane protein assembly factor BamB